MEMNQSVQIEITDGEDRIRYNWPSHTDDGVWVIDVWRFIKDAKVGVFENYINVQNAPDFRVVLGIISHNVTTRYLK